ncbi:MAG: protease-like activity factor CPAF [Halobacteriovoraceae bacterium]|jgi:hypothetical protein|nr:protease-like activity factor CPAF [Halobacteriovoraceae bacterium]
MIKKVILFSALMCVINAQAVTDTQKKMITTLGSIASIYDSMYAPALWKKEFSNWTLQAEVSIAREKILAKEISLSEYHKIVNSFILSMKDYHTSVRFFATEKATLPFMIRGSQGRFFFVYIDRTKLPKESFPFDLGDELLEMNDIKVSEIVNKIKSTLGGNADKTDQAIAEMILTARSASRAHTVPQGPVTLKIKKDDKEHSQQLIWEYEKELVLNTKAKVLTKKAEKKSFAESLLSLKMTTAISEDLEKQAKEDNLFSLGGKKSYLPELGTKIWSSSEESSFDAYIYLNSEKELIGYIRIPSYGAGEKESKEFKEIIKKFLKTTDKLVIDQLNNPGGSVFYLYSLVSVLTDKPLAAPKHYMAINQAEIIEAIDKLKELEEIKTMDDLKKVMDNEETISGYPLSMTFLEFMKSYYQFKIDEWNKGKKLTSPYFIYGVDKINPDPKVQYTKPILLLVNELDFSGGDFFPAIMQDNKRATIMGIRTAGAGGYVLSQDIPNQLGVGTFNYTGSLADRVDHTPIENLGVAPEIDYSLTPKDFQNEFSDFKDRINEVLKTL